MSKLIIEESRVLPSIDEQIEYVKTLRKDVIKYLNNGLDMVFAIEQNLLAVKLNGLSRKRIIEKSLADSKSISDEVCKEILNSKGVSVTSLRIEVLKTILLKKDTFSITGLFKMIVKNRYISRTAVGKIIRLFESVKLVEEVDQDNRSDYRRGRPEQHYKTIE